MQTAERWWSVVRPDRYSPPRWLLRWWRSPVRPVPFVVVFAWVLAARRGDGVDLAPPNPETAVAEVLSSRGLGCEAGDVTWIDGPHGVTGSITGGARALVRAHTAGDPSDLYLVVARLSPEGAVIEVGNAWNVTNTSGVDESRPLPRSGEHGGMVAYTTSADGFVTALHVLDLAGRARSSYADFTGTQRTQMALTNLQQTGQTAGVVHDTFALDPLAKRAAFAWRPDGTIEVQADDRLVVIDPAQERVIAGGSFVRVVPDERARPGNLVTWAVDRVRAMPWFGDDKMQWVKAIAFTLLDKVHAGATTAEDVRNELGLPTAPSAAAPTFVDPEVGWPPAPMTPIVSPPLPGEGRWIALNGDAFITPAPSGGAAAFVTSFLRPDPHRQDVRVYVTLWDPRQIALHMEAGTVEPISANGEHGPGLIPRTPEVMKHVVAAFNGGFQAEHGEYGMEANGIEYLPPKPYAATVVELRDGSNGFGAWPGPENSASAVPSDIVALRQNLTALVQDGKFNPWGRNWWGGAPPGWPDQIHSARSAICLTTDGFVGYFYSTSIAPDDLGHAMLAARCSFGIHLDMNPGHAGFEFYDVAPQGQLSPLRRSLQSDWEAEGKVPDMAGYVFRSRRMIRGMGHMLFPRYIQREARDFFYLTSRSILPGAPLSSGSGASASEPDEGVWRTKGLPQHGFPFALATTWVRSDARAETTHDPVVLRVLRADPRAMTLATAQSEAPTVLSLAATMRGALTLWWSNGLFSIGASAPTGDAAALVAGSRTVDPASSAARAAVGVQDEDGMLVWVELPPDAHPDAATASAMDALLDRLGCSARMALGGDPHALLGGALDVAGNPLASPPPVAARLVRAQAPGAHAIFTDTPIVPIHVWQPLQAKRVRYFYKPAPSATTAAAPPSAAPPLTPPLVSALTSPPTPPTQPANAAAVRSASHAHPSR